MLEIIEKMIETVFDQKSVVALLSHKIQSKDKEMKIDSIIRVKYNSRGGKLKETQNMSQERRNKKNMKNQIHVKCFRRQ